MPGMLATPPTAHPPILHTTLYDLMMTIYDALEPGEEALVVPIVLHLLHTGRITALSDRHAYEHCEMEMLCGWSGVGRG
jgi:hypothetical protein